MKNYHQDMYFQRFKCFNNIFYLNLKLLKWTIMLLLMNTTSSFEILLMNCLFILKNLK